MSIRATIKKLDGTHLDHGDFESEESAMVWFQPFIDKGVYGQKHIPSVDFPAILDEEGVEISPAYSSEEIPAAFAIEFINKNDIPRTQQELNNEAQLFLDSTDWKVLRHRDQQELGIATSLTAEAFQDLLQERQMAREAIVN